MISPSRPMRNFSKFQRISPVCPSLSDVSWSCSYSACLSSPFTSIFSESGNCTPYVVLQNVLISSAVPGSCAPNWLQGIPSTAKPLAPYCSCNFSSPSYWGVSPQNDATFTMSVTLPFCSSSRLGDPSRDDSGTSYTDMGDSSRSARQVMPASRDVSGGASRASAQPLLE